MKFAGDPASLRLLRSKNLTGHTAPLALQRYEFRHVVHADQDEAGVTDGESSKDDREIITGERPSSLVDAPERLPRSGANVSESLQNWRGAIVAFVNEAGQEADIVSGDFKASTGLTLDLMAPALIDSEYRAIATDNRDLFDETVDDQLYVMKCREMHMTRN